MRFRTALAGLLPLGLSIIAAVARPRTPPTDNAALPKRLDLQDWRIIDLTRFFLAF